MKNEESKLRALKTNTEIKISDLVRIRLIYLFKMDDFRFIKLKYNHLKGILISILVLSLISCKKEINSVKDDASVLDKDNTELAEIYENDQADRQSDNINWKVVSKRDSLRELRVYELLDSNLVKTSRDYHNAAMIFQHGGDTTAYGMAVKLMRKSIELDSTADKWLLAAATDRYLISKGEPQIYGTQYYKSSEDAPWVLGTIDTTKISDAVRMEFGVETLAEQRENVRRMNLNQLEDLIYEDKSIDDIIDVINSKDKRFHISESSINSLGYALIRKERNEEALRIFELNIDLYPNKYNTYDSYGECLLILGFKEKGIEAYKKSLELNPENDNARKIIEQHQKS